ncbi:MAG: hypothetical protein WC889_05200 [Myxococcota bacterium]
MKKLEFLPMVIFHAILTSAISIGCAGSGADQPDAFITTKKNGRRSDRRPVPVGFQGLPAKQTSPRI